MPIAIIITFTRRFFYVWIRNAKYGPYLQIRKQLGLYFAVFTVKKAKYMPPNSYLVAPKIVFDVPGMDRGAAAGPRCALRTCLFVLLFVYGLTAMLFFIVHGGLIATAAAEKKGADSEERKVTRAFLEVDYLRRSRRFLPKK